MKTKKDNYTRKDVVDFLEWVNEQFEPEYDMDCRTRFSRQVITSEDESMVWIENHKYNHFNPIFYTTDQVFQFWKDRNLREKSLGLSKTK